MLHDSLTELAQQAPRCDSVPGFRGVLREGRDLARNALSHTGTLAREVSEWYSELLHGLLRSPAAEELAPGVRAVPTGAFAARTGLPHRALEWCAVAAGPEPASDERLAGIISTCGQRVVSHGCTTPEQWGQRLAAAESAGPASPEAARRLLALVDTAGEAGLPLPHHALAAARRSVQDSRPRAVTYQQGLPDRHAVVDIERDVLQPVEALARFLALLAQGPEGDAIPAAVVERLRHAADAGRLSPTDEEDLRRAWESGLTLNAVRWRDGMENPETTVDELPGLQRTSYGAAARTVAATIDAVLAAAAPEVPDAR